METKEKSFHKFLIIWIGEFISSIGSGLTAFTLGVYVFQTTGRAAAVSLVILLAYLPMILLNPIGGVFADRFDRRLMMICGDFFSAFGLIYMLICIHYGELALWQICIGVTVSSIFVSLLEPAYKATLTDLLTENEYARASGMVQVAASSKYLISPAIGGFLLGFTGVETILIIDIATFGITVITVVFIRKGLKIEKIHQEGIHLFVELKEGWKVVTGEKGILLLVVLISFITFYIGFLQTLYGPMILSFGDAKTLGIIQSISALGMLAGSIVIGIFSIKRRYVGILSSSLCLAGILMALIGVTTNIYFITISGILFFAMLPFINTTAEVMIRIKIPNELQGRAWGLIGVLSQLGYIGAYAVAGLMADCIFGPLFMEDGLLADTIGRIIGIGPGRGIGFMLILSGMLIVVISRIVKKTKTIQDMEPYLD